MTTTNDSTMIRMVAILHNGSRVASTDAPTQADAIAWLDRMVGAQYIKAYVSERAEPSKSLERLEKYDRLGVSDTGLWQSNRTKPPIEEGSALDAPLVTVAHIEPYDYTDGWNGPLLGWDF